MRIQKLDPLHGQRARTIASPQNTMKKQHVWLKQLCLAATVLYLGYYSTVAAQLQAAASKPAQIDPRPLQQGEATATPNAEDIDDASSVFRMQDAAGNVMLVPNATTRPSRRARRSAGRATATVTVLPATHTPQPTAVTTLAVSDGATLGGLQSLFTMLLNNSKTQPWIVGEKEVKALPPTAPATATALATATQAATATPAATATAEPTLTPVTAQLQQGTVLSVTDRVTALPGTTAEFTAQLLSQQQQPLAQQEVLLFIDGDPVQQGETDQQGWVHFRVARALTDGDHALKLLFAGKDHLQPALAESVLHYHVAQPGAGDGDASAANATASGANVALVQIAKVPSSVQQSSLVVVSLLANRASDHPLWALLALGMMVGVVASPTLLRRNNRILRFKHPVRLPFWQAGSWRIPLPLWYALRMGSVGSAIGIAIVLFIRPQTGLFVFWRLIIPCLPLLFFLAPALWRNICPMAALNQTPRLFNFSQSWTTPKWMQRYGYLLSISLFLVLVASRKVIFNQNGPALAVLILCSLSAAFTMGNLFKGKSGWCSSICPLLPVQRIYGQTPFVTLTHAHCDPCLGCTKNCYDLNPTNAYLADLYDEDRQFAGFRKAFVALFPGFVLAFYLLPSPPAITVWQMVAGFVVAAAVSLVSFYVLGELLNLGGSKLTVLYGAAALNAYYWFNSVNLGSLIESPAPDWFVWPFRTLVFGLTLFWIYRTYAKERTYIELTLAPQTFHSEFRTTPTVQGNGKEAAAPAAPSQPEVTIMPEGTRLTVETNRTLLEIIESNNLPIESGCRMGLCGADPICVHEGMECLSKVGSDERKTLERLALPPNTRMACMARVRGNVKIGLTPAKPDIYQSSIVAGFRYDKSVQRVVIVGNGIAGVTAADHIRRRHPHCEIHLIGRERHHLYNRMGITRLIYGRSAMQGLYLLPDQWYDDFNITCWLNTHVTQIDRANQLVSLGTGETLPYDRLILTTGSQSFVPTIEGYGMAGSFVLRSADDAMAIRAYVQEQRCKKAVIAGGGLLGLEAAYALHKLGLEVTVLERSTALLTRQLDARSGEFLRAYLERMGIHVLMQAEVSKVLNGPEHRGRMAQVQLKQGDLLACDLLLVAAGIAPDIELASSAGLAVKRAVLVDAQMRTSDPHILAAGDVAEYDEKVYGLWPVAVSQAEVAAASAVAAPDTALTDYQESAPVTMLKVAGIDVTSVGRIKAQDNCEEEIVLEDHAAHRYRKLVIAEGKIVGAILLDSQQDAPGVIEAIKAQVNIENELELLRMGNWESLQS
ncbi:MAG: FAD-dependent oxidoreductase [Caldilineaceae bacterium]